METVELTPEELALIVRSWPFEFHEALGRWLSRACTAAGITDRRRRLALQEQFAKLTGEIG